MFVWSNWFSITPLFMVLPSITGTVKSNLKYTKCNTYTHMHEWRYGLILG